MKIKRYSKADEAMLFKLLVDEGEDWRSYHDSACRSKYIRALNNSITYVAYDDSVVCGYTRCREDDGFGIYVYDLLVRKSHRGRQIGKSLVTQVSQDFPGQPVYVMSDVDPYYEKLGFQRVGSVFEGIF